jgi:serine/threonine-protein phosphatase 2A regulatory subunit B''
MPLSSLPRDVMWCGLVLCGAGKDDFVPFVQELLHFHPGLEFLESHDEFQRKYALTVIARIFFKVNASRTGKLSLREIYASNLIQEFMHVDEETDINRVVEYFSYEHFYVLYCRFFELDADKDSKLTRDDLLKYGEHSLSEALVDR